jgi:hypothetical protein
MSPFTFVPFFVAPDFHAPPPFAAPVGVLGPGGYATFDFA